MCVGWIGYTVAVTVGMGGLTRALMESLLNVTSWNDWEPWETIDVKTITDAGMATALGLLGLLVWLAAIAHLIVMLARNAALDGAGRAPARSLPPGWPTRPPAAWFWKSFRWFHAAAAAPRCWW